MERKDIIQKVPPVKIIIVGGAVGGMSAALRARRLDETASIIFIEKDDHTCYANSGAPSSVGGVIQTDTFLIHQSPTGLKDRFNLDVRDNTELVKVSKEQHSILVRRSDNNEIYPLPYDKLILALGAYLLLPNVPGIDNANVFSFQTMADLERINKYVQANRCRSAVIIGGEYLALKSLESLYHFGLHVNVVHAQERIFEDFDVDIANLIQSELTKNGIQFHRNATIQEICPGNSEGGCVVTLASDISIPADVIVLATGLTPRIEVAKDSGLECKNGILVNSFMQTSDSDIYAVGDVAETEASISPRLNLPPLGGPASQQGRVAADHIMQRAFPYRGPIGTYSCRVPHLTVAIIGPSVQALKRIGFYPLSVTAHIPDHPGYYPTSQQTTVRLAFQQASGRLLSAQILGRSGVERRIDVVSTALQAGMSVFDLENLELSYTPEYGSAKDPVNMVGMIASNLVRGDLHVVSPRDLSDHLLDWQIIDVRSAESFAMCHVPSAVNVPIDELRENLDKFDKKRPLVTYSRVGYHGYLAYRVLVQSGFQVANLDGGLKLLIEGGSDIRLTSS
ncbi:hypothetical protein N7523_000032 [Penicillium sp. IBT 18751x]|nr:hypothetical protein N7523_000032 [Penicillium sp. IBT 18751x]